MCDKQQGGCGATSCGKPGCFSEAHYPVSCAQVKQWEGFKTRDPEQAGLHEYLQMRMKTADANFGIKPCPNCKRPVEKNGACSHMQCGAAASGDATNAMNRGLGCGTHFCWTCGWYDKGNPRRFASHQCVKVWKGATNFDIIDPEASNFPSLHDISFCAFTAAHFRCRFWFS
eukprot:SAG31_NODE_8350_length_1468_cov_1.474799_2_plen_172_part_00